MEEKKKSNKLKIIIPVIVAIVILAIVGIVFFTGKDGGNGEAKEENKIPEVTYNIGDTVSTDIAEFTLNDSKLTIALSNVIDENYGLPKEYNAENDTRNPMVAKTGHTFTYLDFTMSNKDRSGNINVDTSIASIQYNNTTYSSGKLTAEKLEKATSYGKFASNKWKRLETTNSLLSTQEKASYRQYIDISEDIENINDKYYITIKLPTSEGQEKTAFTYVVSVNK